MARFNVPPCAPEWDYATQWELIFHMKYLIEDLIVQVGYWENATQETNQTLHEFIQGVQEDADKCINLTDFHPSNSIEN